MLFYAVAREGFSGALRSALRFDKIEMFLHGAGESLWAQQTLRGTDSEDGGACRCSGPVHWEHSERWTQKLEQWGVGAGYHMWPSAPHRIRGLPFVQGAHGVPLEDSNQGSTGAELHCRGPTVEKQARDGKSVVIQGPRQGSQWRRKAAEQQVGPRASSGREESAQRQTLWQHFCFPPPRLGEVPLLILPEPCGSI